MAQEPFTKDSFWAELDRLGEDEVRNRLIANRYGLGQQKKPLAQAWLQERERSRADASSLEQMRIARSAKNAAWAAAIAAIIAAIAAIVSIAISFS